MSLHTTDDMLSKRVRSLMLKLQHKHKPTPLEILKNDYLEFSPKISRENVDQQVNDLIKRLRKRNY